MIITCRNCKTSFKLSDELIKDTGSKVKCSKCKFIFRVFPPHMGEEQEPAENDGAETLSEIENDQPGDLVAEESEVPSFPVVDKNSSESGGRLDSALATALPVGENDDFTAESDAVSSDTGQEKKDEDFDLSDLDDFFDDESAEEIFSTRQDSEPDMSRSDSGKTDELDLSGLDELFGDEEVELDPFPETSESKSFSEEPADSPEIGGGKNEGMAEFKGERPEAESVRATANIENYEEIDSLDGPDNPDDLKDEDSAEGAGQGSRDWHEEADDFEELDLSDLDELFGDEEDDLEEAIGRGPSTGEGGEKSGEEVEDMDLADIDGFFTEDEHSSIEEPDETRDNEEIAESKEIEAAGIAGRDLDLDLDLDVEGEENASAEAIAEEQEIGGDFDFDFELESEDMAVSETTSEERENGEDLEFDFDLEMEEDARGEMKSEEQEIDGDFDFDFELETQDGGTSEERDIGDEFDLELKMESDEKALDEKVSEESEGDDLDFILEGDVNSEQVESEEEFDLSDLERMVDLEEQARSEAIEPQGDLELNFDIDIEEDAGESKAELESEEFNFKDADDSREVSVERSEDDEDFQLDFDIDEAPEETSTAGEDDYDSEEEEKIQKSFETIPLSGASGMEDMEDELEEDEPYESERKSGKLLFIALLIVFIGVAGFYGYGLVKDMGFKVPFLGSGQPEASDSGNLNIIAFNLDSRFVANKISGKLFVITGEVRNDYAEPRSFIRISGQLYQPGKELAQSETIYAGNVIAEMELSVLDANAIKRSLNNRFGQNNMNVDIKPGQTVPFMIVFSDLPQQLEEYTVSVESSSPAQNQN